MFSSCVFLFPIINNIYVIHKFRVARDKDIICTHASRNRSHTPVWLDTLITWLEFMGLIGAILAGGYALLTMFGG
ncbi:MAG TPA: hypothetical protein VFQ13_03665 [Anaerolineales bacterium]|nr:hypothetical protein [Anaerolineales bacterium]